MSSTLPSDSIENPQQWNKWLWEVMYLWTHLAAASASRAELTQAFVRAGYNPLQSGPLPFSNDTKAKHKRLSKLVGADSSMIERHWDEIQRLLFLELKAGDNHLARTLASKVKAANATRRELLRALVDGDKDTFDTTLNESVIETPGYYANEEDRHLVRFWAYTENRGIPPFCCWTDSALGSYFAARRGVKADLPNHHFEDRREALALIKLPVLIVDGWRDGHPVFHDPPAQIEDVRLKAICSKITAEILEQAFPFAEAATSPASYLLAIDKRLKCLSAEVLKWLREML